jgi:hypothetical protein
VLSFFDLIQAGGGKAKSLYLQAGEDKGDLGFPTEIEAGIAWVTSGLPQAWNAARKSFRFCWKRLWDGDPAFCDWLRKRGRRIPNWIAARNRSRNQCVCPSNNSNLTCLVLRFHGLDLKSVAFRTFGRNEIHRVGGIQEGRKNLPAVLHEPSGNQKLVRMILVQPGICVCQTGSPFGHA